MKRFDVVGRYDTDVDILYGDDGDYVLYEEAQAEIENARRSSEYWKAEHAAANAEIERLNQTIKIPRSSYECDIRIRTLEEAAVVLDAFGKRLRLDLDVANYLDCVTELRRMAEELRSELWGRFGLEN